MLTASSAAAQMPEIDTLLDCQMREVSDYALPLSAWSGRPGTSERFGWLLEGTRKTSMSEDVSVVELSGRYFLFPRGGAYTIYSEWPHSLRIGTATSGELPDTNREYELQVLHADLANANARVVVTHALFRHGTEAEIVDGGYVGSCRIVQGEAASREFKGMSE